MAIPTIRNTWTSVPRTAIGGSNLRHPNTFSFVIPNVIPSTAKNVLIYTIMYCGGANRYQPPPQSIYACRMEVTNVLKSISLLMKSWIQNAYNTNSDNMWFPMPIQDLHDSGQAGPLSQLSFQTLNLQLDTTEPAIELLLYTKHVSVISQSVSTHKAHTMNICTDQVHTIKCMLTFT